MIYNQGKSTMKSAVVFWFVTLISTISCLNSPWRYECVQGHCQKTEILPGQEATALGLSACRILCSVKSALWPLPTGNFSVGRNLTKINPNSIDALGFNSDSGSQQLILGANRIFKDYIANYQSVATRAIDGGKSLIVIHQITNPNITRLTLDIDESYSLDVKETSDGRVEATIKAATFFGYNHGLGTLKQLIIYDDLRDEIQIPNAVHITDGPVYPYRGVLLDTARNYADIKTIKRTLDAMALSKLNSFHWHLTDSHSFPFESKSRPNLTKYGAYSPKKIYSRDAIADIITYGLQRGIRVIPELDAPAHVGEGWQHTGLVTCFDWKPWQTYCVEPPCGQLDPTNPALYDFIEGIYGDMLESFEPPIFHMGGDEVNYNCWNSTPGIVSWMEKQGWGRSTADFTRLWDHFQSQAYARLVKRNANKTIPVVMWTSTLTELQYVTQYLPKEKYIIQIWTTGTDKQISELLNAGYKLILSNYDALYLDCGFSNWIGFGNNWCSPYVGWQKVYENKPKKIAVRNTNQILGAEATLWTEQADSSNIDSRLWPRAAAMAEVLWAEPNGTWRDAESRFLVQRERLVAAGIGADTIEPEWCWQHEESCPENGKHNQAKDTDGEKNSGSVKDLLWSLLVLLIVLISLLHTSNGLH